MMPKYATVKMPCPSCAQVHIMQCSRIMTGKSYEVHKAPLEVLMDVDDAQPFHCSKCGINFHVEYNKVAANVRMVKEK